MNHVYTKILILMTLIILMTFIMTLMILILMSIILMTDTLSLICVSVMVFDVGQDCQHACVNMRQQGIQHLGFDFVQLLLPVH